MTKLRIVLALLVALVLPAAAEAVSDGCLPDPLPTTPTPPVVAENVTWGFGSPPDRLLFEIWRLACLDGSGVAAAAASVAAIAHPGILLRQQFGGSLQGGPSVQYCRGEDLVRTGSGYCNGIYMTRRRLLSTSSHPAVSRSMSPGHSRWSASAVHKASRSRFPPPALRLPSLTVQALGCTTCHPGDTLGFQVRIVNPGPPILVELKTGARLPDGSVVTIQDEEGVLPTGVTVIPVFTGFVLPAGVPPGALQHRGRAPRSRRWT